MKGRLDNMVEGMQGGTSQHIGGFGGGTSQHGGGFGGGSTQYGGGYEGGVVMKIMKNQYDEITAFYAFADEDEKKEPCLSYPTTTGGAGDWRVGQIIDTPEIPIKTIIPLINNEHNHIVGYKKAWRGKQIAIEEVYGSWATTYQALPMFFAAIMKTNLGTIVEIDVVPHAEEWGTSVCKRFFWCLKAMMDGWQHARPVISIYGTFLKERYRGKLLIAMGVDSNNHPFPLCYGLVDEETYGNMSWFLQRIRRHVCRQKVGVCIISDRAAGIISAIRDPQNGFAEPLGIHRIPVERWILSHDTCVRYGQTTTNMFEGFNGNIRRARFLPVTAMMEYLFYKAVTIIDTNQNIVDDGLQQGQQLCAHSAAMLAKIQKKATGHTTVENVYRPMIYPLQPTEYWNYELPYLGMAMESLCRMSH
ncbi:hypothetical protein AgCh_014356 [Apium graveolens]